MTVYYPIIPRRFITVVILPLEKFLPFDWLRAKVFQLNLKYFLVKITVTMVTQNRQIISSHELRKNGGKISRLWNQEIQELKENSENQNTEKKASTYLNVWTSWAKNKNFKINLLAYEAKHLDENKHMIVDREDSTRALIGREACFHESMYHIEREFKFWLVRVSLRYVLISNMNFSSFPAL